MSTRVPGFVLGLSCLLPAAASAADSASHVPQAGHEDQVYTPTRGGTTSRTGGLLRYHNGPTITSAKVVLIFWGASFVGAHAGYAATLRAFRDQLGTTGEYNTITEYSGIQLANLGAGTADWFDTSTPPRRVTDDDVRAEVSRYLTGHGGNDASTVYEVFLPKSSYSSSSSGNSCHNGHANGYCAYHGRIGGGASAIKYSIQPWPSCGDCQVPSWSPVENQEHLTGHETREAVTNPTGTGWWDRARHEADDKCAWSPTPFIGTGGYAYQYEWSNAAKACVRTR